MKTARFPGMCLRCNKAINVGDQIKWARCGFESGTKIHVSCQLGSKTVTSETEKKAVFDPTDTAIRQFLLDGRKIEAINYYRTKTGCALLDAKNYVYCIQDRMTIEPDMESTIEEEDETTSETENDMPTAGELNRALEVLGKYIPTALNEDNIRKIVETEFAKIPKSEPIKIDVTRMDGTVVRVDNAHKEMPRLLYLLSKRHHVYLYGGPGGGKSTAANQAADALNVPFGYISLNPQTPDSRLMGYMDATGNFRETLFYKLYKDGGVFCIDEMDNASPSLLTTLNSCLENGYGSFPNGMIQRHPDFVVVATGNTAGRGANPQFPDRRPFDCAFSERFTFIEWGYDFNLEERITLAINPEAKQWLNWVRNVREYAGKNHPKLIVSPRASFRGAEYLKDSGWKTEDVAEAVLFKGIDKDTKAAILNAHPVREVK